MATSLEKYKADLQKLIRQGEILSAAISLQSASKSDRDALEKSMGKEKFGELVKKAPSFKDEYQNWYSEAQSPIKQLLPNRYADFVSLYEKPKIRKDLHHGNYVIADFMQNLAQKNGRGEIVVGPSSAIPQFEQQLNIVKSVEAKFSSSLFEIKQLVQADLFDSELEASRELLKNKFERAAGAVAGVVLERHLQQVCETHDITVPKVATISVLNDLLKKGEVIDVPQWRFIQRLGDLRNLCDHNKDKAPTVENVIDLIDGTEKITKTVF